jgi:hypothetical protein
MTSTPQHPVSPMFPWAGAADAERRRVEATRTQQLGQVPTRRSPGRSVPRGGRERSEVGRRGVLQALAVGGALVALGRAAAAVAARADTRAQDAAPRPRRLVRSPDSSRRAGLAVSRRVRGDVAGQRPA